MMSQICHECGRVFPNEVYRHPRADPLDPSPMLRTKKSVMCLGSPPAKKGKVNVPA